MCKRIVISLLVLFTFSIAYSQSSSFITVKNNQFYLDAKPFYYIGTNYWYGGLLAIDKDKNGVNRLRKELDFLTSKGIYVLRVLAAAEGSGQINGVQRVGPPTQPARNIFDNKVIKGLDILLYEMGKRKMKAILYLSNNWEWSGGFLQYLRWNNIILDSIFRRRMEWDELRDKVSKFYSCKNCKADYIKQVAFILDHKNYISKKNYKDDAAIMAWELANEPRPMRPSANNFYKHWITDVAEFIKSKDKKHLVTLGHEGEIGTESLAMYEEIHADKNIDYLTIHIWPKNWGWYKDTSIYKDFAWVINTTKNYIDKHVAVAEKLHKPLVLKEFGLPRDQQSFDVSSSTSLRDNYFDYIFSMWKKNKMLHGIIAGVSFWAFGGIARPHTDQIFWKAGDDYMGDPPMEEQGLNTIFDCDSTTWKVITSYTKR